MARVCRRYGIKSILLAPIENVSSGSGSFDLVSFSAGNEPHGVESGDLDGDAVPDAAAANRGTPGGNNVSVLLNRCIQPACIADLDGDGAIGFSDLIELLAAWGPCPDGCDADFTGDDEVGMVDLAKLLGTWGPCE